MAMDADALSALASAYAKGMTSIRGRRVQRLLKREFAGAEHVTIVVRAADDVAVLGVSASGAALCATDGRGPHASIIQWLHGSDEAVEARFDLLKDSLPVLGTRQLQMADVRGQGWRPSAPRAIPAHTRSWVAMALGMPA